jgi:uncharacterized repeat protein (TIGR02543 family)
MKKFVLMAAITAMFTALTLTACFSPWDGEDEGTITINLGAANARTAMPLWPPQEHGFLEKIDYTITLSRNGQTKTITAKGGQTIKCSVAAGHWDIKADAYLQGVETPHSPGGEKIYYAAGANSVEVQARKSASVTIKMNPICQDCGAYPCACELPECQCGDEGDCICGADCDCENCGVIIYFAVTFNSGDGSAVQQTIEENDFAVEPQAPTRIGHTFVYWYADNEAVPFAFSATPITGNITLTAKWTIKTYTVTFLDYDGAELKAESVAHGAAATAPSEPENKAGWHFSGWDADFSEITADLTVTALYEFNSVEYYLERYDFVPYSDLELRDYAAGETIYYDILLVGHYNYALAELRIVHDTDLLEFVGSQNPGSWASQVRIEAPNIVYINSVASLNINVGEPTGEPICLLTLKFYVKENIAKENLEAALHYNSILIYLPPGIPAPASSVAPPVGYN